MSIVATGQARGNAEISKVLDHSASLRTNRVLQPYVKLYFIIAKQLQACCVGTCLIRRTGDTPYRALQRSADPAMVRMQRGDVGMPGVLLEGLCQRVRIIPLQCGGNRQQVPFWQQTVDGFGVDNPELAGGERAGFIKQYAFHRGAAQKLSGGGNQDAFAQCSAQRR